MAERTRSIEKKRKGKKSPSKSRGSNPKAGDKATMTADLSSNTTKSMETEASDALAYFAKYYDQI